MSQLLGMRVASKETQMTQRDYVRIAAVLRQMPTRINKTELVKMLCLMFTLDNPKFKEELFIRACEKGDSNA